MRKLLASLLFVAGCSAAYADQPIAAPAANGPRIAIAGAPEKVRAPYDVQVIRENGETLSTYAQKDRFYVQGNANERYVIRVTNPTANRVEAVVTVDGLDVVDGQEGDLHKRGYVIQPYGEVRIEGFRTSTNDVATFRFSSVNDSYAGKQGKARNVGVIAAAIFEEEHQAQQQIVTPDPVPHGNYNYEDDLDEGDASVSVRDRRPAPTTGRVYHDDVAKSMKKAPAAEAPSTPTASRPAPAPSPVRSVTGGVAQNGAPGAGAPAVRHYRQPADDMDGQYDAPPPPPKQAERSHERPGLGTEFGESRNSAATFTRFVRSGTRPIAIAELRYNDAAGLMALGIPVQPMPDEGELMTRETADPFPGDNRFARAPGR